MIAEIQSLDAAILLFIQDHLRVALLDPIMILMAYIGQVGSIWIVISLVLIFSFKDRRTGILVIATMLICYIFNDIIVKNIIARPRPFETIPDLTVLGFFPGSYSFPSGHACSSFASAFILSKRLPNRQGRWFYILAAVIAISRPYVGVHYVTDMLAGALIGTLGAMITWKLTKKYLT